MMRFTQILMLFLLLVSGAATDVLADSEFFKEFKDHYGELGSDLATKPPAELATIKNFVYHKDVATITFNDGILYLLRHIEGRPTAAIFIGKGTATVKIPSHTERQSMMYAARDSVVNEEFETAFLNFSDDLDLKLKEQFTFERTNLPWRDFNKTQQGEFFFKPVVMHEYDHYFQLMRSLYERAEDGYFWIHFNRYVYSFDPNRPQEVVVGYEHEGGDQVPTDGAVMQREERAIYDDDEISNIAFPTTALKRHGQVTLGGLDGLSMDAADVTIDLLVNVDSLRFVSLFLHHNLKVDSLYYNGQPCDFHRRGSFAFIGVILPEYVYKGDTLSLRCFYHGRDFFPGLPFVEDPKPSEHDLKFAVRKGFDYLMPGGELADNQGGEYKWYHAAPPEPYRLFPWQPLATGYDTISLTSDIGLPLQILQSSSIDKVRERCFIPHDYYRQTNLNAFNFMAARFGIPVGAFVVTVYPQEAISFPGMMGVSQTTCYTDGTGGLAMSAGMEAARQWFGAAMQSRSDRELWLFDALPDYLSIMHVSTAVDPGVAFGELSRRRNTLYTVVGNDNDWPLASGRRVDAVLRQAKGSWVIHMLRYLMFDTQTASDRAFLGFLNELKTTFNSSEFTNHDIQLLAEKHYGESLDWFFHHWVYGRNLPEFNVEYRKVESDHSHTITGTVRTSGVPDSFKMPVIVRVPSPDGTSGYHRIWVDSPAVTFELGPFDDEPGDIVFNEFFSVLSKDKVKKID